MTSSNSLSLEIFRELFEHTSDTVAIFRVPEDGPMVCEDINPAALAAVGLTRKQAVGKTFRDNLPKEEADTIAASFSECARTGRPLALERSFRMNAGEHWFSTLLVPLTDATGRVVRIVSVARNLTENRRANLALSESDSFLASLIESASDAIVAVDELETVILFNSAAERIFGLPQERAFGKSVRRLIPGGLSGPPGPRHLIGRRGDGKDFPVEAAVSRLEAGGRPVWAAIIRDVSDFLRSVEELRASERRFSQAFYDNPAMMSITRLSDRKHVDVNDRWAKVVGVGREEAVGRTASEIGLLIMHKEEQQLYRRLRKEKTLRDIEFSGRIPNGEELHGLASASVIELEGEPCVLWSSLDLTERLRAEAEIRRLNAELERRVAARTAQLAIANQELESFAYSVSHDLRAPLRSIDGFSQALQEDCGQALDEAGKDYLTRVRSATQRMGELIDDLLNLSRVSRGELRPSSVDLSDLARRLLEGFQHLHPERNVEIVIQPGVKAIGDPNLLRIVLDNLLNNAWKYTAKTVNARIAFAVEVQDNQRVYSVSDDGAGYDPAYAEHLFKPFKRLHRADEFEGHGIGLATVLRVVSRHGGRVWAEGRIGGGARFYFTLGTDRGE